MQPTKRMAWVEIAVLEARVVHRMFRWWLPVCFLLWTLLLRVQEPLALRRQGLGFYWPAIEATLVVAAAIVAWAWSASRSVQASWPALPPPSSPAVAITSVIIYTYVVLATMLGLVVAAAVDLVFGSATAGAPAAILLHLVLLVLPVAAVTPGLAACRWSISGITLVWVTAWLLSFAFGAPFPLALLLRDEPLVSGTATPMPAVADSALACACAAAGGWAFSLGIAKLRR
jgi:hypothetical protein